MDPNANLIELREMYRIVLDHSDADTDAYRLAELVEALDTWLSHGGFLPDVWKRKK